MNITSSTERGTARRFRRAKYAANAALVVAAAGFVLSRRFEAIEPALGLVRAFCEAAMVGALADWFAVTALFRRPLGLPIPHTAIIPANKDRIGASLGYFVQSNFLSEEVLASKLAHTDLTGAAARWLIQENNASRVSRHAVQLLPDVIASLGDSDIQRFLHDGLKRLLEEIDLAEAAAAVLELTAIEGKTQPLFDEVLKGAEHVLRTHRQYLKNALFEELPWYVPAFVHDRVYRAVLSRTLARLSEIRLDRRHAARERFTETLKRLAEELRRPGALRSSVDDFKQWMLVTPALTEYVERLWRELKQLALTDALAESSRIEGAFTRLLRAAGENLLKDEGARLKFNEMLRNRLARTVRTFRGSVVDFIAGTVRTWDTETLVAKLELEVGRDLQYIRLNGTIVGGAVGVILHLIAP